MTHNFQWYLDENLVKKSSIDLAEAKALMDKAEGRLKFSIKSRSIDDNTATYIFEDIYECLREASQSLMSLKGYKPYSHEALISFLHEFFSFHESDLATLDRLRILRNKAVYRGEKISALTCKEAFNFLIKFLPILQNEYSKLIKG